MLETTLTTFAGSICQGQRLDGNILRRAIKDDHCLAIMCTGRVT